MTPKNHSKEKEESYLGVAKTEGFALVIALSLMAFVLLLLLSISTLVRVEVGAADRNRVQLQARQSALLGLQIAVGELQSFAGPDQRVTATANIAAGADGGSIVVGASPENNTSLDGTQKGLSAVVPGTRYWTGVFKNRDDPEEIYQKTPSVSLQRWLVSGHNNQTTLPTPADNSYSVGADGKVGDASIAILLAGPNSLGEGADAADRYVAAPRVLVADASATNASSTAFAYWVGDEGVKARINMPQVNTDSDYASLVAQRRGWETVAGFDDYPLPGSDEALAKVFNLPELAVTVSSLGQGSPATPLESVFHSATPYSRGLLVNTLEGGTQIDLTALLAGTLPGSSTDSSFANYPASGGRVVESSAFTGLQHLTWNHLQKFYQAGTNPTEELQTTGSLQVRAADSNTNTIAPTITDLRLLFGVRLSDAVMVAESTDSYTADVHLVAKVAVTLSNPYSVPLEWGQPLELEIKNNRRAMSGATLTVYSVDVESGGGRIRAFNWKDAHYLPGAVSDSDRNPDSRSAVLNRAMFQIPAGRLEPGEAIAYSHAGNRIRSYSDIPVADFDVELEPLDLDILEYSDSLEMTIGSYTFPRGGLQIRAGVTSCAVVELRDGSAGGVLRRITNIELNNPYRRDTVSRQFDVAKVFNPDGSQRFNGAVPLLLYKFQTSQPGEQYEGYGSFDMGLLGSTLRTYTDFNLRATDFHNPIQSYNPPPYFMQIVDSKSDLDWYNDVGGETGSAFTENFVFNEPSQFWGYNQTDGTKQVVLYSFPSQFVSLAQLQHADMTQDAVTRSVAHQPGNAFGNSYATPFIQRNLTQQDRTDYELGAFNVNVLPIPRSYYDIAYILNSAIWDRYFFSTIPAGGTLPGNSSMLPLPEVAQSALNDANLAATGLVVDGAFNVNSTETEAWKAFLGSSKHFRHPVDSGNQGTAATPRSLGQLQDFQDIPSGKSADSYAGYRRLSDSELEACATEMVRQVRLRGPFVSRSHFINRALADLSTEPELSRSGALQTALDESGINIDIEGNLNKFTELDTNEDRVRLKEVGGVPALDIPASGNTEIYDKLDLGVASIVADREMLAGDGSVALAREQGYRSTGIPGWVTQADVLQVVGPAISARSDTFRIRTAGQSLDLSGDVQGTAYLEAVVQRMPEYVDPSNAANERDTADTTNLTQTNQQYGRKFEIISVRWLSPDEI